MALNRLKVLFTLWDQRMPPPIHYCFHRAHLTCSVEIWKKTPLSRNCWLKSRSNGDLWIHTNWTQRLRSSCFNAIILYYTKSSFYAMTLKQTKKFFLRYAHSYRISFLLRLGSMGQNLIVLDLIFTFIIKFSIEFGIEISNYRLKFIVI